MSISKDSETTFIVAELKKRIRAEEALVQDAMKDPDVNLTEEQLTHLYGTLSRAFHIIWKLDHELDRKIELINAMNDICPGH